MTRSAPTASSPRNPATRWVSIWTRAATASRISSIPAITFTLVPVANMISTAMATQPKRPAGPAATIGAMSGGSTRLELRDVDVLGIRAANPSMFTLSGTNTWIVRRDPAWLVDPGPALPDHLDALEAE